MKYLTLIFLMTMCYTAHSQSTFEEEKKAVEDAVRDYIEGWYKGDSLRIERSMHDDLVKRIPMMDSTGQELSLRLVPKSVMVKLTSQGGGEKPDAKYQIFIDDIEQEIATARVLSLEYLDYLHLVKTKEGWQIVNILFRKH